MLQQVSAQRSLFSQTPRCVRRVLRKLLHLSITDRARFVGLVRRRRLQWLLRPQLVRRTLATNRASRNCRLRYQPREYDASRVMQFV